MRPYSQTLMFSLYSYAFNLLFLVLETMPPFVRMPVLRRLLRHVGRGSYIDYHCYLRYPGKISIGSGTYVNRGCRLYASYHVKDAVIVVGSHVALGPEVSIFSASHDYTSLDLPDSAKSVVIRDHVWIGGRAIVLPGVEIGEGAVIGAGSVVTRDIPPYSVAVGNPARVIRKRTLAGPPAGDAT